MYGGRPYPVTPPIYAPQYIQPMQPRPAPRPAPIAQLPPAKIRGVSSEDKPPAPVPLRLPSPADLGISEGKTDPRMSWDEAMKELRELGLTAMQLKEVPSGGWRFVGQFKTSQAGRFHRLETPAAQSETQALVLALTAARDWSRRR